MSTFPGFRVDYDDDQTSDADVAEQAAIQRLHL